MDPRMDGRIHPERPPQGSQPQLETYVGQTALPSAQRRDRAVSSDAAAEAGNASQQQGQPETFPMHPAVPVDKSNSQLVNPDDFATHATTTAMHSASTRMVAPLSALPRQQAQQARAPGTGMRVNEVTPPTAAVESPESPRHSLEDTRRAGKGPSLGMINSHRRSHNPAILPEHHYPAPATANRNGSGDGPSKYQQEHQQQPNRRRGVPHVYRDYSNVPDTTGYVRKKTGGVTQPFPEKLHELLEQAHEPEIVGWLPHGRAFLVRKPKEFTTLVMPK